MSIECCKSYVGKQIIGLLPSESVEPPVANFSGSPTSINIGDTVAFTDLSTNTPTSWSWAFAGGSPATSTTQNPSVVYNTAGTYNVDLTASNAGGSDLESKPNYITVINPYLLDNYSGAGAAYSVRKLSSSYTGAALRVRRSSDNTEQDIGFVGLDLDTTALTSFVGAGTGFVTKWYDQSGNNRDMVQTFAGLQPTIISSGSLIIRNGNLSIYYNNTFNIYHTTSYSLSNGPFSTIGVVNVNGTTSTSRIGLYQNLNFSLAAQNSSQWGFQCVSDLSAVITTTPSVTQVTSQILPLTNNSSYLIYANWNGNSSVVKYRRNGINATSSGLSGTNIRKTGNPDTFFNGFISEFIIYPSDQASNVAGMETNINGYYNIYP